MEKVMHTVRPWKEKCIEEETEKTELLKNSNDGEDL